MASLMKASTSVAAKPVARVSNKATNGLFKVWRPNSNKFFETFSYLPPLTNEAIAKQVDYIVGNGWIPALEFANDDVAYTADTSTVRLTNGASVNYYDNRYWTLWKLPLFGCTDASQVLKEIASAEKAFPDAYIRLAAFDNVRQVQVVSFLVHRPKAATDYRQVADRSV